MTEHVDLGTLAMFQEGLLDASDAADIRSHLDGCARCSQATSQLDAVAGLLASAPAPAMPPGLSARIEAALAAEATARAAETTVPAETTMPAAESTAQVAAAAADGSAVPADATPGGSPVPGVPAPAEGADGPPVPAAPVPAGGGGGPRSRPGRRTGSRTGPPGGRPPGQRTRVLDRAGARLRIVAAAAAIAVLGGGGYAVAQFAGSGGTAASSGRSASGATRPVGGPAMANPAVSLAPNQPGGSAIVSTVRSGVNYTPAHFTSQVRSVLHRFPADTATSRPSASERALSPAGVAGCVRAVSGGRTPRLVDLARYQDRVAMIIVVARSGAAPAHAWVVALDCSATRPDVLASFSLPGLG